MIFQTFKSATKKQIEKEIGNLLKNVPEEDNLYIKKFYQALRNTTTGGKYVRGSLVLLGYMLVTEKDNPHLLPIAAAFEILHTSLLIHDDIIDKSSLRRNKKSLWKEVGINQALCLGDLGFFIAYKTLTESSFDPEIKIKATSLLSEIILHTISGEMLDISLSDKKVVKKEHDVLTIHKLKTAFYTISGPLMLGALLGGADENFLKILKEYGEYLGIAFQIQDDILGTFGNEKKIGKSVTSDAEENKNTLLIAYALMHATTKQKQTLKNLYGKAHLRKNEQSMIQKIFKETGSLQYSEQKAQDYVNKAKKLIPLLTKTKTLQEDLAHLSDFVIERVT